MKTARTPLASLALGLALFAASCGGGSSSAPAISTENSPGLSTQAANADTTRTIPAGSKPGNTPTPIATAAASQSQGARPEPSGPQVAEFTNGLLGDGQQPLFWMQIITGDRDCGSVCNRSIGVRWQTLSSLCQNGRWEARRTESGYSEAVHGEAVTALIESCAIIAGHVANGGTPADNETWQGYANEALNRLWPALDTLAERQAGG